MTGAITGLGAHKVTKIQSEHWKYLESEILEILGSSLGAHFTQSNNLVGDKVETLARSLVVQDYKLKASMHEREYVQKAQGKV